MALLVIGWLLAGIGALMVIIHHDNLWRCPTPEEIVTHLFLVLCGAFTFLAVLFLIVREQFYTPGALARWWTTPICGKK